MKNGNNIAQKKETTVQSNLAKQFSLTLLTSAELNQVYGGAGTPDGGESGGEGPDGK
ncbi:MAG: hypothetical protein AB4372_21100 [Xenococcus sp. (in: cyanobacteria)]